MNPLLSPEHRATDLVRRMTLEEKATQMQNNSAAVPRLKVPAYALDRWLTVNYPRVPFERYADDGIVHCRTEKQA